jgi:hypothetical protein
MTVPGWKYGEELEERVECGTDYGNVVGFFVRMSVTRDDGGTEWVSLTPGEADRLAGMLHESAENTRIQQKKFPRP